LYQKPAELCFYNFEKILRQKHLSFWAKIVERTKIVLEFSVLKNVEKETTFFQKLEKEL
jgi:hypothetical protein